MFSSAPPVGTQPTDFSVKSFIPKERVLESSWLLRNSICTYKSAKIGQETKEMVTLKIPGVLKKPRLGGGGFPRLYLWFLQACVWKCKTGNYFFKGSTDKHQALLVWLKITGKGQEHSSYSNESVGQCSLSASLWLVHIPHYHHHRFEMKTNRL